MKKTIIFPLIILIFLCSANISAQVQPDKVKAEITEVLKQWNAACKKADVDELMSLFDNTDNIILIGSDSGEIFKGKVQMRAWLTDFCKYMKVSWDMDRVDIDYNDNTAWVFVDGLMNYENKAGKTWKSHYRFTGIMVKKDGVWKWRLFDGSKPKYKKI
jgi:ketosteroid isomerase-like protein